MLPEVTIGRRVIVEACSEVTRDAPDHFIVAGNPARVLRTLHPPRGFAYSVPLTSPIYSRGAINAGGPHERDISCCKTPGPTHWRKSGFSCLRREVKLPRRYPAPSAKGLGRKTEKATRLAARMAVI